MKTCSTCNHPNQCDARVCDRCGDPFPLPPVMLPSPMRRIVRTSIVVCVLCAVTIIWGAVVSVRDGRAWERHHAEQAVRIGELDHELTARMMHRLEMLGYEVRIAELELQRIEIEQRSNSR